MKYSSLVLTAAFMILASSFVYSQTKPVAVEDTLQIFQTYLSSLNPNDITTLDRSVSKYSQLFENSSAFNKDTAFIAFWKYYVTVADSLGGKYVQNEKYNSFYNIKDFDENNSKNDKLKQTLKYKNKNLTENDFSILKTINHYGYKFDMVEGVLLVSIANPKYILNNFSGLISPALKQYITKVIEEIDTAENSDAAPTISPDEIANQLLWWENFIKKNGDFFLIDDCISTYYSYLYILMLGTDNSPAFNYEDQKLKENFRKTYEKVINRDKGSKAAAIISKYYNILKKNNFIINDEAVNFAGKFIE